MAEEIELQIKNPSKNIDGEFKLTVPATSSVGDVKSKLHTDYPGHPRQDTITIIYAGRVLKQDDAPLARFLQQNLEPGVPHTLHIVVKPSAPGSTPPASSSRPQPLGSATAAANTDGPQGLGDPNEHMLPNSMLPMELNSSAHPAAAVTGSNPSAEGLSAGQYPPDGAAAGAEQPPPPVSAPIQGYAYTIPSPYAIYNPSLSAAYTAALQAIQAATPPAPQAAASPSPADTAHAPEGPYAAYQAALHSLHGMPTPTPAPSTEPPPARPAGAESATAMRSEAVGAAAASAAIGQPSQQLPGAAAGQTEGPQAGAGVGEGAAGAAAAAAAVAGHPPGGVVGVPPNALPVAYLPALIPVPQPVLTAFPSLPIGQGLGTVNGQQVPLGAAGGGLNLPLGQPALVQGIPPGVGQFIPVGPMGVGMFPGPVGQRGGGDAGQPPMQVHLVEAVPGEGVRRRRIDVNQPGAVPPEVVDALRAAHQRGQLPGNMAQMVAQLQRQQAARREARRARGFHVQINLGRINMRAVLQLVFMMMVMAPYFSMRRLAIMLIIAAMLNLARLDAVRRGLNRMVGQLNLPLQQEEQGGAARGAQVQQPQRAQQPEDGVEPNPQPQVPREAAGEAGAGHPGAPEGEQGPQAPLAAQPPPDAAGDTNEAPGAGQQAPPARRGVLQEVQALVVGFVTSLLPGWNVDPGDAAAFVAAQEADAEEQAAAAGQQAL